MKRPFLVSGAAGFIGAAVCKRLLSDGKSVIGIDNLNNYYDPELKLARLKNIEGSNWEFRKLDVSNNAELLDLFGDFKPQ